MAPSAPLTPTQEQLIQLLLPKSITTGKSRKYREAFNRRLRHHNYGRTNQFEVTERLDGLEEKFQVLNRDDLSDALRTRRVELRDHENERRSLPDVLDLLTRLSVDPANTKRSDRLISVKEKPAELPPLRWSDIEENDPIDHKDPIWQNAHYSDLSSDEDIVPLSSTATSPQSVTRKDEEAGVDGLGYADRIFAQPSNPGIANCFIDGKLGKEITDGSLTLTELQATRECLFMLQGLPTTLYSGESTAYDAKIRYCLRNVNQEVFRETLRSFSRIGKCVEFVRAWLTEIQATQYMRTLQQSISNLVLRFDAVIAGIQAYMLQPAGTAHVGLLPSLEAATQYFRSLHVVWRYLQICQPKKVDSIGHLEVLFSLICSEQAAGRERESLLLFNLFTPMFEVYLKPVVYWMKYGELHESLEAFFVISAGQQKNLTTLWEGWFLLDESQSDRRVPHFLKDFSQDIFALGKTSLFLNRLNDEQKDSPLEPQTLITLESLTEALKTDYLSFAEAFTECFGSSIKPVLSRTSAKLYQQLDQQCGLWTVLDAFDCIYFAKHGPITDRIETTLFRRLDKCNASWSDRFLLLDLFENAFGEDPELDTDRLVVHSSHASSRSLDSRRKSVKILGDLSVDYSLPWQIANIIPQSCFTSYRRMSLLLMQIRRSRYSLERRAHIHVRNARLGSDLAEQNISRALYQKLLLFGNILYNHLTALVLDTSTSAMKARMRQASTVDEMTRVHSEYLFNLEKVCLTSKKLTPIRDTIVGILDLSVRFSDIVSSPPGQNLSEDDARSFRSARSRHQKRRQEQDSEDDEDEISSGDEGYSTFVVLDEPSPYEEFKRMSKEFDRYLTFVIAGLKSLGRVGGEQSWDILAGRLDWKRKTEF
jgi:gamma-tubulin complex component 5